MSAPFMPRTIEEMQRLTLDIYRRLDNIDGNRGGVFGNVSNVESFAVSLAADPSTSGVISTSLSTSNSKDTSQSIIISTNLSVGNSKDTSQSILVSGLESKNTSQSILISNITSRMVSHGI